MIAKVNFDGTDRLAIVFSPCQSIDELFSLRSSLLCMLSALSDDYLSQSLIAPVLNFIEDINSTDNQYFEMYKSYFADKSKQKEGVKVCKLIY